MLDGVAEDEAAAVLVKTRENPFGTPRLTVAAAMSARCDALSCIDAAAVKGAVSYTQLDVYKRQRRSRALLFSERRRHKRKVANPMIGLIGAMAVELEQLKAQMADLREETVGMDVYCLSLIHISWPMPGRPSG